MHWGTRVALAIPGQCIDQSLPSNRRSLEASYLVDQPSSHSAFIAPERRPNNSRLLLATNKTKHIRVTLNRRFYLVQFVVFLLSSLTNTRDSKVIGQLTSRLYHLVQTTDKQTSSDIQPCTLHCFAIIQKFTHVVMKSSHEKIYSENQIMNVSCGVIILDPDRKEEGSLLVLFLHHEHFYVS